MYLSRFFIITMFFFSVIFFAIEQNFKTFTDLVFYLLVFALSLISHESNTIYQLGWEENEEYNVEEYKNRQDAKEKGAQLLKEGITKEYTIRVFYDITNDWA